MKEPAKAVRLITRPAQEAAAKATMRACEIATPQRLLSQAKFLLIAIDILSQKDNLSLITLWLTRRHGREMAI